MVVEYRDPNGSPCGFVALHRLQAPTFPDTTSIGSLIWEVTFPYEQFLFLDPSGFSSEFRWQRQSVFWSRQRTALAADIGGWLGTRIRTNGDDGNSYAFSRYGAVPTIVVGSMAQSFVVFIGAGLSLLAAFVLFKVPLVRLPAHVVRLRVCRRRGLSLVAGDGAASLAAGDLGLCSRSSGGHVGRALSATPRALPACRARARPTLSRRRVHLRPSSGLEW